MASRTRNISNNLPRMRQTSCRLPVAGTSTVLMTFSNLDCAFVSTTRTLERNRHETKEREKRMTRDSRCRYEQEAIEVYYNRRLATWCIRFFPRINCHRRGFFVIKMILYLETRTADNLHAGWRGHDYGERSSASARGGKLYETLRDFVDYLGSHPCGST